MKTVEALKVLQSGNIDNTYWFYTDCFDYEHYKTLPNCVDYQGVRYGLTGWNSDKSYACYQNNASLAFFVNRG